MESLRKWFYKPKKDDKSLLAQFFYADEALNMIANELDSFDGRKDPERCTTLVNQLRQSQDKVLTITNAIMDILIGDERANRDFRVKFPEDVLQENLAGQLWFGAECLAAGSSIMNRESESTAMRPLAKTVTKSLENVRNLLRESCLRNNIPNGPIKLDHNELVTDMLLESLKIFDKLFAEFELSYVSAMVPVKSTQEYEQQEYIGVLFSETLQRALKMKLLTQEMIDDCDPALMFTIPRLAIVSGLLIFPSGPLCIDKHCDEMSTMFRPFRTLLHKIRELLWTLNKRELYKIEKLLCDNEEISDVNKQMVSDGDQGGVDVDDNFDEFIEQFYQDHFLLTTTTTVDDNNLNFNNNSCYNDETNSNYYKSKNVNEINKNYDEETTNNNCYNNIVTTTNNIPSTSSGYLIPNSIAHDIIVTSITDQPHNNNSNLLLLDRMVDSPPDHDSLEIISEAAATLSSILSQSVAQTTTTMIKTRLIIDDNKVMMIESPNDSGISTENTSLDRSPSLDLTDDNNVVENSPIQNRGKNNHQPAGTSSSSCGKSMRNRRQEVIVDVTTSGGEVGIVVDEDSSSSSSSSVGAASSSAVSSSDTSSFNSTCADDEEIALAMQAAEIASRNEVRAKYSSSDDLIHRLFVCIAGVADQLQTNFASDLRNILKSVFLINTSDSYYNTSNDNDDNNDNTITTTSNNNIMNNSIETTSSLVDTTSMSLEYRPSEHEIIENENEFSVDPNILAQEALFDTNVVFHLENSIEHDYSNHPRGHLIEERGGNLTSSLSQDLNRYASLREDVANLTTSNGGGGEQQQQQHQQNVVVVAATDHPFEFRDSGSGSELLIERPPIWIPDVAAPKCMSCGVNFTVVKRRHHCRNCGKIFCARCSSNSVPLPKFGHAKPVRVCNKCFIYNLTPFTM